MFFVKMAAILYWTLVSMVLVAFLPFSCEMDYTNMDLDTIPPIGPTSDTTLKIGRNNICEIPDNAFENMTLEIFIINNNCLDEFPDFPNQKQNIQRLDLSGNLITYIPKEKFYGFIKMYQLLLSWNPLRFMPDFSSITYHNFNLIMQKCPGAVKGFKSSFLPPFSAQLRFDKDLFMNRGFHMSDFYDIAGTLSTLNLGLADSAKRILTKEDMAPMTNLKNLLIGSNLERLPDFTLLRDNIVNIVVKYVQMKELAMPELIPFLTERPTKINLLDIYSNKIKRIPGFQDMKKALTRLNTRYYILDCDCRLLDFIKELQENDHTMIQDSDTPCATPLHLRGIHYNDINITDLICTESLTKDDVSGALRVYEAFQDNAKKPGPYLETMVTKNALNCARQCRSHPYCWSFNFNEEKGHCDLVGHQEVGYGNNAAPGTVSYDLKDV